MKNDLVIKSIFGTICAINLSGIAYAVIIAIMNII